MSVFSIAVDLGGTNLRIAAVSEDGRMLEKVTTGTEVQKGRDHVITEMCDAIQSLTTKHKSSGTLAGIGIGVPGFIDMDTGTIMRSPNLQDWANFPVRQEIERKLGTKVILENDANSAAMGEKWLGAGRNTDHMAMYTLGTGVGGGIVMNGRLWHGMNGMAAELGHFNIESEGVPCGCGSRGCLEQYASATAIVRMARELIASHPRSELARAAGLEAEVGAKAIYQLAKSGDQDAKTVFRQVGRALGIVIAGLVNSLNLAMYVIGGGVSSAWDEFSPTIFEELRHRSMVYAATDPAPVLSAGGQGAA